MQGDQEGPGCVIRTGRDAASLLLASGQLGPSVLLAPSPRGVVGTYPPLLGFANGTLYTLWKCQVGKL